MSGRPLRTTQLFALVSLAALALAGIAIWQVVDSALRDAGVDATAADDVRSALLPTLAALGAILLGVVITAARAYARSLRRVRELMLSRARGDAGVHRPDLAVRELDDLLNAAERLAVRVTTHEANAEREGADVSVLLDAITDGIIQVDGSGRIVRANPAASALLGLTQSAVGKPIRTQIRHAQLRRLLEHAIAGTAQATTELVLEDRRVMVSARPLRYANGRSGGAVVAFVDLTEIRRLEGVRRDFVANVSHELKTPLTSIRGYVETLMSEQDLPAATQRDFLEIVRKNAERLQHIVDDLLDLSRLESGGWRPDIRDINVRDAVEDAWTSCGERAARKSIGFAASALDRLVQADPDGLRHVLSNLFDNALRHTPEGGRIEVRIAEPPAAARARNGRGAAVDAAASRYIAIEVRDTGSGIPSDALPRIFERFYRADPARSRAEGGTGLGLSIVRHIVERMGGDVEAESELGKGTTIRFTLPAA
ncbi:MAG TPA: ATP-binding protein [Longimicrobiales bacterium]